MTQIAVEPRTEAGETARAAGRFDIYAGVHKGLRRFMSDTLVAVGGIDVNDAEELAQTVAQVRGLLEFCLEHLHVENQFLHPAMEARRPGSACASAKGHDDHLQAIERLEWDARAVEGSPPDVRAAAALRLYRRLALFVAENLEHMHVEETENNAVLWATHTDEELVEIQHAIVASITPGMMAAFLRWAVPAMTPVERAGLFTGMQAGAPREVFERMLATARPHLSERAWTKLMAALGPVPVFA
ncbi:MAG TPA: hemerythrin domain-containing protein [Burkholderiales bacterium]|nr:hemerythrin domain-containing protein [Burkholderiales bacterium]